jgi:hypothetical protein
MNLYNNMARKGFNLLGSGKGLGTLIPVVIGGAIGVFAYKTIFEKAEQEKLLKDAARATAMTQMAQGGSQAIDLSYNTVPYTELTSTTEWNPEDLNFSGSISRAYTFVTPYSPI